jgi:hypothetical protein
MTEYEPFVSLGLAAAPASEKRRARFGPGAPTDPFLGGAWWAVWPPWRPESSGPSSP